MTACVMAGAHCHGSSIIVVHRTMFHLTFRLFTGNLLLSGNL